MNDDILLTGDATIATVALNNPGRLHALHKAMCQRLGDVMCGLSAAGRLPAPAQAIRRMACGCGSIRA